LRSGDQQESTIVGANAIEELLPKAPSWVDQMLPGCWYRISGDSPHLGLPATRAGTRYLKDNDPAWDPELNPARTGKEFLRRLLGRRPYAPWAGRVGFASITEAWNGAVFASRYGESGSMICFGGGHDDYFGSDVHAFDLATRRWSRISDGYVSGAANEYGAGAVYPSTVYPDGSPLPPHTYGYVQYDPVGNDYLLLKGQLELGPAVKPAAVPHMFNVDSLTWRRGPKQPSAILASGGWTAWDAARRILWGHSGNDGNAFVGFSPDGDNQDGTFGSWGERYPNKVPGAADHNAMQKDPVRDILVVSVAALDSLHAIDPSAPDRPMVPLSSRGDRPRLSPYAALEYSPVLDRLIYYSASDGPRLHSIIAPAGSSWSQLTQDDWTWRSLLDSANVLNPVADAQASSSHAVNVHHTFGRFRVATYGTIDIAILVRHTDSPVYAMRLN
jgi:hypothetical protein